MSDYNSDPSLDQFANLVAAKLEPRYQWDQAQRDISRQANEEYESINTELEEKLGEGQARLIKAVAEKRVRESYQRDVDSLGNMAVAPTPKDAVNRYRLACEHELQQTNQTPRISDAKGPQTLDSKQSQYFAWRKEMNKGSRDLTNG